MGRASIATVARAVRAIRRALFGPPRCAHRWETVSTFAVRNDSEFGFQNGHRFHLRCRRCGDMAMRDLIKRPG